MFPLPDVLSCDTSQTLHTYYPVMQTPLRMYKSALNANSNEQIDCCHDQETDAVI